jgi:hypothetical protein
VRIESPEELAAALEDLGLVFEPLSLGAAQCAGHAFAAYRQEGGRGNTLFPTFSSAPTPSNRPIAWPPRTAATSGRTFSHYRSRLPARLARQTGSRAFPLTRSLFTVRIAEGNARGAEIAEVAEKNEKRARKSFSLSGFPHWPGRVPGGQGRRWGAGCWENAPRVRGGVSPR